VGGDGDVPCLSQDAARRRTVCAVCEPEVSAAGAVRVVEAFESVRVSGLIQHVKRVA
jgi:hypothetical protein